MNGSNDTALNVIMILFLTVVVAVIVSIYISNEEMAALITKKEYHGLTLAEAERLNYLLLTHGSYHRDYRNNSTIVINNLEKRIKSELD